MGWHSGFEAVCEQLIQDGLIRMIRNSTTQELFKLSGIGRVLFQVSLSRLPIILLADKFCVNNPGSTTLFVCSLSLYVPNCQDTDNEVDWLSKQPPPPSPKKKSSTRRNVCESCFWRYPTQVLPGLIGDKVPKTTKCVLTRHTFSGGVYGGGGGYLLEIW